METPNHETRCRRCGRCCYEKLYLDGAVFTTRRPCPHLDVKTKLCAVYDRRFAVNPRCLSVAQGIRFGVFPAACPYVQGLAGYRPSEEGWLDDRIARLIERGALHSVEDVRREIARAERAKNRAGT